MTQPTTAAGRALLEAIAEHERLSLRGARIAEYVPAILAIEAEVRADLIERMATFYARMHDHFGALDYESSPHDENCIVCREWVASGAPFIALLRDDKEAGGG